MAGAGDKAKQGYMKLEGKSDLPFAATVQYMRAEDIRKREFNSLKLFICLDPNLN